MERRGPILVRLDPIAATGCGRLVVRRPAPRIRGHPRVCIVLPWADRMLHGRGSGAGTARRVLRGLDHARRGGPIQGWRRHGRLVRRSHVTQLLEGS